MDLQKRHDEEVIFLFIIQHFQQTNDIIERLTRFYETGATLTSMHFLWIKNLFRYLWGDIFKKLEDSIHSVEWTSEMYLFFMKDDMFRGLWNNAENVNYYRPLNFPYSAEDLVQKRDWQTLYRHFPLSECQSAIKQEGLGCDMEIWLQTIVQSVITPNNYEAIARHCLAIIQDSGGVSFLNGLRMKTSTRRFNYNPSREELQIVFLDILEKAKTF